MFRVGTLILLVSLFSCNDHTRNYKAIKSDEFSTLDSLIINDSSLFMFEFSVLNMNTHLSLDSIRSSLDTIEELKGFAFSIPKKTTTFYSTEFNTHKSLVSAIRNAGYTMDNTFVMKGPGLTCDVPAEPQESNGTPIIENVSVDFENIKRIFNENSDKVRVISLPNPSCLACVKGQRFINSLFRDSLSSCDELFGITVWLSIRGWGSLDDANRLAPELSDPRMAHFWDETAIFGKALKSPLGINEDYETTWDTYLVYDKGLVWDEAPPKPSLWMHQLTEKSSGVKRSNFMNYSIFSKQLSKLLADCLPHPNENQQWGYEN